jgi:hypothetical protein
LLLRHNNAIETNTSLPTTIGIFPQLSGQHDLGRSQSSLLRVSPCSLRKRSPSHTVQHHIRHI